jgi:glutamine synthetase
MSDAPARRLSGEEIRALKFAAHRQLARWANKPTLSPHQHAQRNVLKRAVRALQDQGLAHGCELRAPNDGGER